MGLWSWLYNLLVDTVSTPVARSYANDHGVSDEQFDQALSNVGPIANLETVEAFAPSFVGDPTGVASMLGSVARDGISGSMFDPYAGLVSTGSDSPLSSIGNSPYAVQAAADAVNSAMNGSNESSSADTSFNWGDYFAQLYETEEEAARNQAQRNEEAAYQAYLRSEVAAENAMKRARELRQTQYQDAVFSLKAAGLNPVLAASGGISGSSTTAPQANAPSSSSSAAGGINITDLLTALGSIVSSAGNLLKGLNPANIMSSK